MAIPKSAINAPPRGSGAEPSQTANSIVIHYPGRSDPLRGGGRLSLCARRGSGYHSPGDGSGKDCDLAGVVSHPRVSATVGDRRSNGASARHKRVRT
jgi:hypothetical protein